MVLPRYMILVMCPDVWCITYGATRYMILAMCGVLLMVLLVICCGSVM